jgi:Tripartite tricarboxylate transporter TctB family
MPDAPGDRAPPSSRDVVKSQVDLGAGLFLIALALIGVYGSLGLRFGQLTSVGPALMPRSVAVLIGVFGIGLVISSFLSVGPRLEGWHFRGPVFVLGAVVMFALTIRGSTLSLAGLSLKIPQLGLIVAGPLAVIISSMADKDTRPVEIVIFTIVLTAVCIGVFRFLLRLPLPILPLGY